MSAVFPSRPRPSPAGLFSFPAEAVLRRCSGRKFSSWLPGKERPHCWIHGAAASQSFPSPHALPKAVFFSRAPPPAGPLRAWIPAADAVPRAPAGLPAEARQRVHSEGRLSPLCALQRQWNRMMPDEGRKKGRKPKLPPFCFQGRKSLPPAVVIILLPT